MAARDESTLESVTRALDSLIGDLGAEEALAVGSFDEGEVEELLARAHAGLEAVMGSASLGESVEAVKRRQLQAARALQARAVEVLQSLPPERGIRVAGALQIGWKHELLLLGEPTGRRANIGESTKRELVRWLCVEEPDGTATADGNEEPDGGDDDAEA